MLIVFSTCPNAEEALSLANKIVSSAAGACVQVLPQMTSVYVWEGKVETEKEHLLLIKTLPEKWEELRDLIAREHSYSVPEIVAVDSKAVHSPYAEWLTSVLAAS